MELEKAIHNLEDMAIFYKIEKDSLVNKIKIEAIETVLKELEKLQKDSISKKKIENAIEELEKSNVKGLLYKTAVGFAIGVLNKLKEN